jgi:subfamily B ATP-binding cassette protein HlyB/CyaB
MTVQAVHTPSDSGLLGFGLMLRLYGVDAKLDQLRRQIGNRPIGASQMLKCAKAAGLRARTRTTDWDGLSGTAFPALATLQDGRFLMLGKIEHDEVFVVNPEMRSTEALTRQRFESIWTGQLLEMARPTARVPLSKKIGHLIRRPQSAVHRLSGTSLEQLKKTIARFELAVTLRALKLAGSIGAGYLASRIASMLPDELPADDKRSESGLGALILMLRIHGINSSAEQIQHRCGSPAIGATDILRCAKELGLKAKLSLTSWDRLNNTPLPGIAALQDGNYLILGKFCDDHVLVQQPSAMRPEAMTRQQFEAIWDGRLVLMARRAKLSELSRRFDITWFLGAIHKYRYLLGEVLLASFFLQVFALVSPLFFQVVIDKVLVHQSWSTLNVLTLGLLTVSFFEAIVGFLRTYLFAHTTNRIDVELGARLFRHLLALPISYFQSRRVGDSVARVRELENIRQFLTGSALTLVIDLFFAFVFIALMFYYSPLLTGMVLASLPAYVAISALATPLFRRRLDEKFRRGAENQAFLVESVTAVETLKSMAIEPQMQRTWEEQLAAYVSASFRVLSLSNLAGQAVQLVNKLSALAILYFGAKVVIAGNLSVGELVAFNMLASRVSAPVLRLAQMWQDFHQARLSIERLGDILNTHPEPNFVAGRANLPPIQGEVQFEHVSFRYRLNGSQVLHDVSFTAKPGEVIGIVGSSGSGKSTLTKLIQRLYAPESGRILIDGVDLAMVEMAWLRRQIGVVLQENILFNRSVLENIALSDPAAPMERVVAVAKLAGAHEFILELPEGYDTIIGERGSSLSGGQRQRIAIARALICNPRILILDEATSALDYESERAIQQNMEQIVAGRTVFIIAHRLSTVRRTDRIITLERGRVVEDGNHDQLIRSNGRYAKLHYLQAGIQ